MRLLLVALVACSGEAKTPKLPGTIYFLRDGALTTLDGRKFDDAGAQVFPSQHALPDGRLVGIASEGTGEPGSEQLVLIGPGSKIERIGPANTQVRRPAVDPKGAWIVIESKVEPHSELYLIDLATQQTTQLTNNPEGNFEPAAIDSQTIVFVSSRDGDSEIYKLDLVTKQPARLTAFHRDDWSPRPSPDRKTLAFISDREQRARVFLVDPDGANLRRLTKRIDANAEETEPVWSPDGKSIAYVLARPGKPSELYLHDVATGEERLLTPPGASDVEPAFSPDGKWIAVSRNDELVAIQTTGDKQVQLTNTKKVVERLPRWL